MRKLIFFFGVAVVFFSACKSKSKLPVQPAQKDSTVLQDTIANREVNPMELMYPADMMYVIGKEYEEIFDSSSAKSQTELGKKIIAQHISLPQYMEMRLLELYPQKAFRGIMADFDPKKFAGLVQNNNQIALPDKGELKFISSSGTTQGDVFHPFISPEDEVEFLNMSPRELKKYQALNALAKKDSFATVFDFEVIRDSIPADMPEMDKTFLMEENIYLSSLLFVSGGSYLVYRVLQTKERASYKAYQYYGPDISCGKRGDAFKHLYVSMMLRRYLTEGASKMVMDEFWERTALNSPCDRQMDLHNNYVGRNTQYDNFRGSFWQDMYDWEKWGTTIHGFVEGNKNSIEKNWDKAMPEYFIINDLKVTNKSKYVFWNPTSECEDAPFNP
ncbi:MAG: hypothetical protein LBR81_05860 [Prevotellaceae bacterium]|jgi:hypothetical protein|nr:hypothetical protein [Prevotellaceae bacterium]